MPRIDTHQHFISPDHRAAMEQAGVSQLAGPELPAWSTDLALSAMAELGISAALLSAPTPGTTFLRSATDAAALARHLNDFAAEVVAGNPHKFGCFATLPMPHIDKSVQEASRALDELHADGVWLPANFAGTYLRDDSASELLAELDSRSAVVFIHPAGLPCPPAAGMPPVAADFLLDTTRAAYLIVRDGIPGKYPKIRFLLSHAGGFLPFAAERLAFVIATGDEDVQQRSLHELSSFYFDTALSGTPTALPSLLAFADPARITFGSDWPFANTAAAKRFSAGLRDGATLVSSIRERIEHRNAQALFPRFAL